jgi:hypothetical protein
MSTSRNTGHSDPDRPFSLPLDGLGSLSRYDVLLAVLPLGFALALLGQVVLDLSLHQAVAAGAVLGSVVLADALFLNPPTEERRR